MPTIPQLNPYGEFFARQWNLDIACPACGYMHMLRYRHNNKPDPSWDPLLSTFACRQCRFQLILGVVGYPPPRGGTKAPPADHQPKAWHLAQMRELVGATGPGGFLLNPQLRPKSRQEVNLLLETPCTCPTGGLRRVDDACPVHGRRLDREAITLGRPKQKWTHRSWNQLRVREQRHRSEMEAQEPPAEDTGKVADRAQRWRRVSDFGDE
jgi:hypothetical protein